MKKKVIHIFELIILISILIIQGRNTNHSTIYNKVFNLNDVDQRREFDNWVKSNIIESKIDKIGSYYLSDLKYSSPQYSNQWYN